MDSVDHSPSDGSVAAILPAAGSGRRFGDRRNKLFASLAGKPLWYHSAARLFACKQVGRIVMPIAESDRATFEGEFRQLVDKLRVELVTGGAERTDSVRAGLNLLEGDDSVQFVAVHDGGRPVVAASDLDAVFAAATRTGAAILATPIAGTVKRDLGGELCETIDRRELWVAQTPQVFRIDLLREAYARHRGKAATDDAQLVERMGKPITLVPGSADNLKITHPEDLRVAAALLASQSENA